MEASMRLISISVTISLALLSSAALAQQPLGTAGDTIGPPPQIPGPPPISGSPPISEPSPTTQLTPAASTPPASAPKGYTGAYAPVGIPPTPYSTGPLPKE